MSDTLPNPLTFTVIAAGVSTIGTLAGLFIKDFFLVRYFDKLKEKKELQKISKKYQDPILLTATELKGRISEYVNRYDALLEYSTKATLYDLVEKMDANDDTDKYFRNYRLVSTLYRFCSFFGWLELYRQEITFLDPTGLKSTLLIWNIKEAVADGQLNDHEDWHEWHDRLIFREELRAIGEGMIENDKDQRSIMGYNKFRELIRQTCSSKDHLWLYPAINFFTDLQPKKDFRHERFRIIMTALDELIQCLDTKGYYEKAYPKARPSTTPSDQNT